VIEVGKNVKQSIPVICLAEPMQINSQYTGSNLPRESHCTAKLSIQQIKY